MSPKPSGLAAKNKQPVLYGMRTAPPETVGRFFLFPGSGRLVPGKPLFRNGYGNFLNRTKVGLVQVTGMGSHEICSCWYTSFHRRPRGRE